MRNQPAEVICLLCDEGEQRVMTWEAWERHLDQHSIRWARQGETVSAQACPGEIIRVGRVSAGRLRADVCRLRLKLLRGHPSGPTSVWEQDAAQLVIPTRWDRIAVWLMEPLCRWSEWLYRERRKRQRVPWKVWMENRAITSVSSADPSGLSVPKQHNDLPEAREEDPPSYRLPGTPVNDDRGEDGT